MSKNAPSEIFKESNYSLNDLRKSAAGFNLAAEAAGRLWPELKRPYLIARDVRHVTWHRLDGYDIDVSVYAQIMDMDRATAIRQLREWEQIGLVSLVRDGRHLYIHPTSEQAKRSLEYLETLHQAMREATA